MKWRPRRRTGTAIKLFLKPGMCCFMLQKWQMPLHSGKFHPNELLYAVYMFVFLRVDPETTQVHHPNLNHVEPTGSDFSFWVGMDWSMLTPRRLLVCKKRTNILRCIFY